jgi:MinD superfamily P-loop ATPase
MKIRNISESNDDHLKQVVIISGKGGTGKTTLAAAFTKMTKNVVVADCDVDAADLPLVLKPEIKHSFSYLGTKKAVIDPKHCTECSLCVEYCRFDAIHNYKVDPFACEGCGFCYRICPENAIIMQDIISGYYYVSVFSGGDFVFAALEPGEGNSGKLVSEVKNRSKSIAQRVESKRLFVDGPPGIGCPVNASIAGVDFAIIVTEPTVSGLHDLKRVVQLIKRFHIPAAVVINKYDLNQDMTNWIEKYAIKINLEIAGKIPFDENVDKALLAEKSIIEFEDSPAAREISHIWDKVNQILKS